MRNTTEITRGPIYRFTQLALAKSFTERAPKIWMIILGDDMRFWVVPPADADRLQRLGYELAK